MSELLARYDFLALRETLDHPAYNCPRDQVIALLTALRDEHGFDLLMDVTAIDHYEADPRFEVLYHLFSSEHHHWLRIATPCGGDSERPTCPTAIGIWPAADWHERETYDLMGIHFEGHPDLRRILMWDSYPFHPLRKEFPLAGIDVPLPSDEITERTGGVTVAPAPMMGGPFHAPHTRTMKRREPRADDESWNEVSEKDAAQATPAKPRELT